MRKKKPIRKYSVPQRIATFTKYGTQQAVVGSLTITLITLHLLFILLSLFLFFGLLVELLLSVFTRFHGGYATIGGYAILFCFVSSITCGLCKAVGYVTEPRPVGHFLNPIRPEPNEIMPEKEVLVRASAPDNTVSNRTLLHAANGSAGANPETLLRASEPES